IQANEEDTGSFNFLKLISDADGTPDTEFTINQDGDIDTDGGITAAGTLTISALDCTGNANGGALTANGSGVIACSDDDGGGGSPEFDDVYANSLTAGNLTMEIDSSTGLTFNMTTTGNFDI